MLHGSRLLRSRAAEGQLVPVRQPDRLNKKEFKTNGKVFDALGNGQR